MLGGVGGVIERNNYGLKIRMRPCYKDEHPKKTYAWGLPSSGDPDLFDEIRVPALLINKLDI